MGAVARVVEDVVGGVVEAVGDVVESVVDVVQDTSYVNGSGNVVFPEVIVRWNFEIHTTTIASGV